MAQDNRPRAVSRQRLKRTKGVLQGAKDASERLVDMAGDANLVLRQLCEELIWLLGKLEGIEHERRGIMAEVVLYLKNSGFDEAAQAVQALGELEGSDHAEGIREDEGAVHEGGAEREGGHEEGGEDLQRAPGEEEAGDAKEA